MVRTGIAWLCAAAPASAAGLLQPSTNTGSELSATIMQILAINIPSEAFLLYDCKRRPWVLHP
jgi:hypothetical protein